MLDEILRLPNGAHFYRADLHTHTPADPGFNHGRFNTTTEAEKQTLARAYVKFLHEEQQIDIVAITDHNEVGWIKYIQEAAAELYPDTLTVFPGVELGANEGKRQVHFLALFNPDTNPDHIDHFISSLGLLPHTRFHDGQAPTPRLTQLNTRQLTQRIVSGHDGLPGLPIAAHATRKNGLLHELEGEGRVLAYEDPNLIALEIPSTRAELSNFVRRLVNGEENHYGYKSVACLNSSDGRSLTQTTKGRLPIGGRATRIKLSTFSIEALRHALIDHDSRIRLDGEHHEQQFPRLLGLTIHNGFLATPPTTNHQPPTANSQPPAASRHSSPFQIHFNPNLNTIIGGRGSGKSSLLEALRFVFDLPPRTQATANQHQAVIAVTLPKGAKVTAYYELTDGRRYQITRRPGHPPDVHAIDVDIDDNHTLTKIDIHPSALIPNGLPLEVYGQKEVYEIANDPQFQLNLIDSFIATQLQTLTHTENDLLRDLDQNAQAITQLQDKLTEAEQQLTDLPLITHELEKLEQDTTLQTLQHKKQLEHEKHTLTNLQTRLQTLQATITKTQKSAQSASSASQSPPPPPSSHPKPPSSKT